MREDFKVADIEDLGEITRIFKTAIDNMCSQEIFQWDEIYPDEALLRDDISKRQMYVLAADEKIVSAVVINDEQMEEYKGVQWKYEGEKIAVLHRLCVDPVNQNKGCGRRTVLLAEEEIKRKGYTAVRLDAFSENPFALKLYECLRYEKVGEVRFRKGRFFLYEKKL